MSICDRSSVMSDFMHFPGGQVKDKVLNVVVTGLYESLMIDGYLFKNKDTKLGANLLKPWVDIFEYGKLNGINFLTPDQVQDLVINGLNF